MNDFSKMNNAGANNLHSIFETPQGTSSISIEEVNKQYAMLRKKGMLNLSGNNDELLMDTLADESAGQKALFRILSKRSNSKEIINKNNNAKKQTTTRASQSNRLPTIFGGGDNSTKVRVSS